MNPLGLHHNLLGVHFKMLFGDETPDSTASLRLNQALQSVEVTHRDEGPSAFQLSFSVGRSVFDVRDYPLVKDRQLQPFKRVVLVVFFNLTKHILIDGIITNLQLSPSNEPGASTLTVTGEDVSVMMDLEERSQTYDGRSPDQIVEDIIDLPAYSNYRFRSDDIVSDLPDRPSPDPPPDSDERRPTQPYMTDRAYIQMLANRYGFVFYVRPGRNPGENRVYWGPPNRLAEEQGALLANMGPHSNIESISFQYDTLAPNKVRFSLHEDGEDETGESEVVEESDLREPFARQPAALRRTEFFSDVRGLTLEQARRWAQGQVNRSMRDVVTATGELDAMRYGRVLEPRGRVDLRGVGLSYDGTYYVKSVTHRIDISGGEYKQSFTLTREGVGAKTDFISL